jgi:hypothetical protein
MSDFGLATFKASPLGKKIEPIISDPEAVVEMRVLAKYGHAPVQALDARLAHLKPEVGVRAVNSQLGRWAYEKIGESIYEVAGRVKLDGEVFHTGATFKPKVKESIRIERLKPRSGGPEYPVKTAKGYELVKPGLSPGERTQSENATHVATLEEAVKLLDDGYHIRMGRKGVRSSFIAKKSLKITKAR